MKKAPILFLIFNRPLETFRVFEKIRHNQPKSLYVAADGPRIGVDGEIELCNEAKKILQMVDWDCEVKTLLRVKNLGCKLAVSSAIDWFFDNEERGIILEDDVIPHDDFFDYCTQMLEKYEEDSRVMMVAGTNHGGYKSPNSQYFFSKHAVIWGWATWRRAWKCYDIDISGWKSAEIKKNILYSLRGSLCEGYYTKVFDNIQFEDTWDGQWAFTCLRENGLTIVPNSNLVTNIGVNGTRSGGATSSHFLELEPLKIINSDENVSVIASEEYDKSIFIRRIQPELQRDIYISILRKIRIFKIARWIYRKIKK